jgi:hypothetical protein
VQRQPAATGQAVASTQPALGLERQRTAGAGEELVAVAGQQQAPARVGIEGQGNQTHVPS